MLITRALEQAVEGGEGGRGGGGDEKGGDRREGDNL